jgi:glycosyltransferase involved in cell wall biosynthesis
MPMSYTPQQMTNPSASEKNGTRGNPLRILFSSRTTLFSTPGGDTTMLLKTAESLRELGCEVTISNDLNHSLDGYDIVHLFNLTRPQETYHQARRAISRGIPVILTPIYVDYTEADRAARGGLQRFLFRSLSRSNAEYLKMLARVLTNGELNRGTAAILSRGFRGAQRDLIQMTSVLLPNSESEMARIRQDFPETVEARSVVVPNSVDPIMFDADPSAAAPEFNDCILSVGRIERRKCQLQLVRALKGTGLKLVLVGKPGPNQIAYFEQIKREMDDTVTIIDHVDQSNLRQYYAACKVHALVSWMETTGLSSLEAAAMGANIVITDKGDTRDYFADLAYYCSPDSVPSIREALLRAHSEPRSNLLRERVLNNYTWTHTAQATFAAYSEILGSGRSDL